jgi:ferredoxin
VAEKSEKTSPLLTAIAETLNGTGLVYRGGFHPRSDDDIPPLRDGTMAGTVLLIGNAGPAMWRAFTAAVPDRTIPDPLDRWLNPILDRLASKLGVTLVLPNRGPDFPPVQDWAMRAEPVYRSPLGILIHPDFGLWHVYRAALLFKERVSLPPRAETPNPCDTCATKPCLKVCPADAFKPTRFDAQACVTHVDSPAGTNCQLRGCLARRACPVGRDQAYPQEAGAFHMAAVVRAVRAGYGAT